MEENDLEKNKLTVSEKIRSQPTFDRSTFDSSLVEYIAKQMEKFPYKAGLFIRFGADAIVVELEGNKILKIFPYKKHSNNSLREFDIPILEEGSFEKEETNEFFNEGYYIIQPKADTNVSFEDTKKFIEEIKTKGYKDVDIGHDGQKQLGFYNGKLYLLDYNAVE
jgi:hypothetical protein